MLVSIFIYLHEALVLEDNVNVVVGVLEEEESELGMNDTFTLACRDYPKL